MLLWTSISLCIALRYLYIVIMMIGNSSDIILLSYTVPYIGEVCICVIFIIIFISRLSRHCTEGRTGSGNGNVHSDLKFKTRVST